MIIKHNEAGTNSIRVLNARQSQLRQSMAQLSSGQKINSAGDNPASFAVSEKLRNKISGLGSARQNAVDGLSLVQTTEGYLTGVQSLLSTAKALAVQSSNGVYSDSDRANVQVEFSEILKELNRIQETARYNGQSLLKGDFANPEIVSSLGEDPANETQGTIPSRPLTLMVGVEVDDTIDVYINGFNTEKLGLRDLKLDTEDGAKQAIQFINKAVDDANRQRVALGSYQVRLNNVISSTDVALENFRAAESNIRDTDIAEVISDLATQLLTNQVNISMISQANVQAQSVLRLLS